MKILIMTFGTRGDVQPFLPLAHALKARGHAVSFFSTGFYEDMIRKAGHEVEVSQVASHAHFDMHGLGGHGLGGGARNPALWWPTWRGLWQLMVHQAAEMWRIGHAAEPDLILYHPFCFPAPSIARSLGARAVPVFLQPAFEVTGAHAHPLLGDRDLGRVLNRLSHRLILGILKAFARRIDRAWQRKAGVAPARGRSDLLGGYGAGGLRLHAYSRALVPPPPERARGSGDHNVGYFFRPRRAWKAGPKLQAFLDAGAPPVYVGFGSMPGKDIEARTRMVIAALREQNLRGILSSGLARLSPGELGEDMFFVPVAAHQILFPRCRAVVHHGGAGTTHEGLRWGRPSVILPLLVDQPFWGRIVRDLGVGAMPCRLDRLSTPALAQALGQVLTPEVEARASELGGKMRKEDGCARACELIAALEP